MQEVLACLLNCIMLGSAGGAQAWRGDTSQTASSGQASTSSASNGSRSGAKAAQPAVSSLLSCARSTACHGCDQVAPALSHTPTGFPSSTFSCQVS